MLGVGVGVMNVDDARNESASGGVCHQLTDVTLL